MITESLIIEGIIPVAILIYTIVSMKFKIDGRIPIGIALGLLVISAIILAFKNENLANNFAIVCYYFLVSGVAVQFVEFLRENKEK